MLLVSPARLNLQERGSSKQGTVQATLLRNKADGDNMFRSERWPPFMVVGMQSMTRDITPTWRMYRYPTRDQTIMKTRGAI